MKIVFVLLVLGFIKSVVLYRTYHTLPLSELRRQARAKDKKSTAIYKVAAGGPSLDLVLWTAGLVLLIILILWSTATTWSLAVLVMLASSWLVFWAPKPKPGGWVWSYTAFVSPLFFKFLSFLQPVLQPLAGKLPTTRRIHVHSGLYEKQDLLDLLNSQNHQIDNRIAEADLHMAFNALSFGDRKVADVMTPRRKVKFVLMDEPIGPMLMDDLHKTGFSRFPVVKELPKKSEPQVVGTLYIKDLLGYEGKGKISDLMRRHVHFINEAASLHSALGAFLRTHNHLLVVVNNFEETVGIISLEDVLEQILSQPIVDEFSHYDDLRAVAGFAINPDQAAGSEVKSSDQTDNQ